MKKCKMNVEWFLTFISNIQQSYQPTYFMAKWLNDTKIKLKQLN